MKRHLPVRLMICAALVGSASLATVAGFGGVAGAATPLKLTCTKLVGTEASQTESGCTGTAAVTADAGKPPATGVETSIGSVPKSSGTVAVQVSWKASGKHAILAIKETALTKSIPASDCAATHAGTPTQKLVAYVTYTGSVVKSEVINKKTYTTTALGMVGGAAKGADCVYETGSGATLKIYLYNKGSFTL